MKNDCDLCEARKQITEMVGEDGYRLVMRYADRHSYSLDDIVDLVIDHDFVAQIVENERAIGRDAPTLYVVKDWQDEP